MKRLTRTKIEWLRDPITGRPGFSINPVKGLCPVACSYCYARRIYKRFKWNPEIRMEPDWQEPLPKEPARIFVGSTMELFGDWVEEWMWDSIWQYVNSYPQHTFIFLTKEPQNLAPWSPFPPNAYVGVSVTNQVQYDNAIYYLEDIQAPVKFFSFEPLQESMQGNAIENIIGNHLLNAGVNWLVCGQQTPTRPATMPKLEWVAEIVEAADKLNIPVFLKNNLNSCAISDYPVLLDKNGNLRQEVP
mgnify:CR=1 FL=1